MRANPNKDARGIAIEANLDKGRGSVATVLVQSGTLHVGDTIVAGTAHGRVRAMFDDDGSALTEAGPSRPVQVLGLSNVPRAGDTFFVTADERTARQIAEKREAADRNAALAKRRKRISLEDFDQAVAEGKIDTLNLILKGEGVDLAFGDGLVEVFELMRLRAWPGGVAVGCFTLLGCGGRCARQRSQRRCRRRAGRWTGPDLHGAGRAGLGQCPPSSSNMARTRPWAVPATMVSPTCRVPD